MHPSPSLFSATPPAHLQLGPLELPLSDDHRNRLHVFWMTAVLNGVRAEHLKDDARQTVTVRVLNLNPAKP